MRRFLKTCIEKLKKLPVFSVACFLLIVVCALSLWSISKSKKMAQEPVAASIRFEGEYKIADGDWQPLQWDKHIPTTTGDVTLRGNFVFRSPDGEVFLDNPNGVCLNFYFNHLSAAITVGEESVLFDAENPQIGVDACGAMWLSYVFPESEDGLTEIVFSNPHSYGNEKAIDQFLENIYAEEPATFVNTLSKKYDAARYMGFALMAMALVLCGFACVTSILKLKVANTLWIIGGWMLFTGGFFVMDVLDVFLWNGNVLFNTAALSLCKMLSLFFLGAFVTACLTGKHKKIAVWAHTALGGVILTLTLLSAFDVMRMFDATPYWQLAQLIVVAILCIVSVREMLQAGRGARFILSCCTISLLLVVFDFVGLALAWWSTLYLFKTICGFMFIIAIGFGIYTAVGSHKISVINKEMEAELKDKSIAVMISQIQPHFLYNSLNSIAELCVVDPKRAEKATIDFSRYLRGNMGALNEKRTIEFEDELNHLQHYIELEKLRYGNDLQFEYDIRERAFTLPALTVQPLVENAVNHGIRYYKTKGKVKISSYSDEKNCYVQIEDDGVGFDVGSIPADGKKHVGLSNVTYRVAVMCGGRVDVQSEKGKGTKVTVVIPKEQRE